MQLNADRVVEELGAAGFKDRRLALRLRGLAERFVVKPSASTTANLLTLARGYAGPLMLTAGWEAAKLQQTRDQ